MSNTRRARHRGSVGVGGSSELATQVDDIDQYVEAKSAFLSGVLARAGLTQQELDVIAVANRAD